MKTQRWSFTTTIFYVSWNKKTLKQKKLYLSGFDHAEIYGTPKMHRLSSSDSFSKLRPIFSSIGTFNYNLDCFLCDLISPLVPNDYSCKDVFSFVSQAKSANHSKKFIVSNDVTIVSIVTIVKFIVSFYWCSTSRNHWYVQQ